MPARWMQAKIAKRKRMRRAWAKSYNMNGVIRKHTGAWPATARALPKQEFYDKGKIKDDWLTKLVGGEIKELDPVVDPYQRIVLINGQRWKVFLLYCHYSVANADQGSIKVSDYRIFEYHYLRGFVRVSHQFNSRERAVEAWERDWVKWAITHSIKNRSV